MVNLYPNIIKSYGFYFGNKEIPPVILLEYSSGDLEMTLNHLTDIDLIRFIYEKRSKYDFGIAIRMDVTTQIFIPAYKYILMLMLPELF